MLSASANDKKVNQVTPALFDLADTPEKMAALTVNQIKTIIRDVGLAGSKSKNVIPIVYLLLAVASPSSLG